jgi:hypothetical protein
VLVRVPTQEVLVGVLTGKFVVDSVCLSVRWRQRACQQGGSCPYQILCTPDLVAIQIYMNSLRLYIRVIHFALELLILRNIEDRVFEVRTDRYISY